MMTVRLVLAFALSLFALASEAAVLPLRNGATFTYAGTITTEKGTTSIRWKCWVAKTFVSKKRTVAIVRGLPFELAWYEAGQQPGYSVIVEDTKRIAIEPADDAKEAERIAKRAAAGEEVGDTLIRFPVKVAPCRYCWGVERALKEGWELVYRTNPDHQLVQLVPGAGITSYVFEHHGTPMSVNVRLVR